ncbi:MAG: hypothetical protein ACI9J3_001594 [Parvicellaceae bacterium]
MIRIILFIIAEDFNYLAMKKNVLLTISFLCVFIIMNSCSIQKRHYRGGFNINWKGVDLSLKNRVNNKNVFSDTLKSEDLAKATTLSDVNSYNDDDNPAVASIDIENNDEMPLLELSNKKNASSTIVNNRKLFTSEISTISNLEIKQIIKERKDESKEETEPRNGMPTLVKLGLILLGLGLIFLIVAFWTWYFALIGAIAGVASTSSAGLFLTLGIMGSCIGLGLLIISWLFN